MNFRQMARQLDKNAIIFLKTGEFKKAFAAMECAATIRRMGPDVLKLKLPEFGEN